MKTIQVHAVEPNTQLLVIERRLHGTKRKSSCVSETAAIAPKRSISIVMQAI